MRPSTSPVRTAAVWLKNYAAGYPGWVGGMLTGIQGALATYLAVTILALVVIASAPGPATVTGVPWGSAFTVATTVFLMAHGVPAVTTLGTLTLVPLGLTVMSAAALAALARRFAARTWTSGVLGVGSYVAVVGLIAGIALAGRPDGGSLLVRACAVAVMISAPAISLGIWRAHGAEFGWLTRVPSWLLLGLRRALAMLVFAIGAAAVAALVFAIAGRNVSAAMATGLGVDGVGGVVLAIGELAYVPTMIVWMLAWLTGQGFSVGVGSSYAPDAVVVGALPHVPLLGALPAQVAPWMVWVPVVLVSIGAVVRVVLRSGRRVTWNDAKADGVVVVVVTVGGAALFAMASGAAGPGRLAESVGVDVWAATLALVGWTMLGVAVVAGAHAAIDAAGRWRAARAGAGDEHEVGHGDPSGSGDVADSAKPGPPGGNTPRDTPPGASAGEAVTAGA